MATRASRIALAGSNISSTGEVDADLLDNTDSAAFLSLDGSGRLLLGTTTEGGVDADNLTISGNNRVGMTIRSANSGSSRIYFSDGTSGAAEYVGYITYDHLDNHMRFGSAAAEAMRIVASGNVGIGTASPSPDYGTDTVLEVSGAGAPGIVINDTGQASKYGIHADSNDLKIAYGSGVLATFQNDGNVGIGNTNPQGRLHLNDSGTAIPASGYGTGLMVSRTDGLMGTMFGFLNSPQSGYLQVANFTNTDTLPFLINPRGGNVGIGTTTPAAPLDFGVTSTNQQVLLLRQNGNSRTGFGISNDYGVRVLAPHDVTSSGSLFGVGKNNGTTYSGDLLTVLYGGNVGIGTTSPDNPLEVVGADSGIKISSAAANRPQLRLECGTTENLVLSTNTTYGAIGDSTDLQRYMTLQDGDVKVGTGVLAKQHPQYGYTSWLHVTGGASYINVKTNIYRSNKMYMLKLLGFVSYAGERIDTIITGYAYSAYLGNSGSSYSAITNHGVVGVALYYSSDNYLCFRTTTAGGYNSIDIQASTGAPGYHLGHPVEILAYTSISGTGNHYA